MSKVGSLFHYVMAKLGVYTILYCTVLYCIILHSTIFPLSAAVFIRVTISAENRSLRGSSFDLVLAAFNSGLDLHQRSSLHHQAEGGGTRTRPILKLSLSLVFTARSRPRNTKTSSHIAGRRDWRSEIVRLWLKAWLCGRSFGRIAGNPTGGKSFSCECCVLSDRGLCVGLITRPEESYRLWCV
jgi:hypothetical protein